MIDPSEWIATSATITSCRFQFARMNTFTLGVQTGEKFRITFDYYAHGRLYSDEFQSPIAIPQGEQIPLRYNPLEPQQNTRSNASTGGKPTRSPLIAFGIAGSIVLSLMWLLLLRGCS